MPKHQPNSVFGKCAQKKYSNLPQEADAITTLQVNAGEKAALSGGMNSEKLERRSAPKKPGGESPSSSSSSSSTAREEQEERAKDLAYINAGFGGPAVTSDHYVNPLINKKAIQEANEKLAEDEEAARKSKGKRQRGGQKENPFKNPGGNSGCGNWSSHQLKGVPLSPRIFVTAQCAWL